MIKWIKGLFNKAVRAFKKFIAIAFPIALQAFIGILKDFAISVVSKLETTDLSNSARRNEAFSQIKAEAISKGMSFQASWIYILIEIALQVVKQMNEKE